MLIGEYRHNLDAKKRLAIPVKFRKELGGDAIMTKGLDGCLFVFPKTQWDLLSEKVGNLPMGKIDSRSFARLMLAGASEIEFDGLGRVLIPEYLKEYAGLDKKIVIAGIYNRLEIWNEARWLRHKESIEKNSDSIAEKLGEMGII